MTDGVAHLSDLLKAIAAIISSVAWPALVGVVLFRYKELLFTTVKRVTKVDIAGLKIEMIDEQIKKSEVEAAETGSRSATDAELSRSRLVLSLTTQADLPQIYTKMINFATEYTQLRSSMRPGGERTNRLEGIVAKMRTLGAAAYPLRQELAGSTEPGQRLAALAILQVRTDLSMADWIVTRASRAERPFIQYHALLAFLFAVRNASADDLPALRAAFDKMRQSLLLQIPLDSDRKSLLGTIDRELKAA